MVRQLHGQDTTFLHLDASNAHMGVTMLYFYDQSTAKGGKIRFKQILKQIDDRIGESPVFRRKLERLPFDLDYPYWVDDDHFDVEFHVRHVALPKPGDWRQFCIQVARFHARPLDLNRPLWEMCVIEGLDNVEGLPKSSFAIATKMHHAVVDGHTAMEITWNLHDTSPNARRTIKRPPEAPQRAPGAIGKLCRMATNNVSHTVRIMQPLAKVLPPFGSWLGQMALTRLLKNNQVAVPSPVTRFQQDVSHHRVWDMARFSLDGFKEIRLAVPGSTVNDVVLATVAGALKSYLEDKGEGVDRPLPAICPVNVRPENEFETAGNRISVFIAQLPLHLDDPLDRLKAIVRDTTSAKELSSAIGAKELADINKFTPPVTLALVSKLASSLGPIAKSQAKKLAATVITNVPGPQQPLYLLGARLVNFSGVGPILNGMGLFHAIASYDGKIGISVTSCRDMMPDPHFYAECLQTSFDSLHAATVPSELPAGRRKGAEPIKARGSQRTPARTRVARVPASFAAQAGGGARATRSGGGGKRSADGRPQAIVNGRDEAAQSETAG